MGSIRPGDQGDGTYRNPILCADYSDPDVIAVDGDYYLVASSFNCIPGLPILHSQDLVNWSMIGYAIDRLPDASYDLPRYGAGVWAPSIRHHDGRFAIVFGMPDEGIYVTTAADIRGPWSTPHCMRAGAGLIDPCPFWDDDGQAWLIRAQAASRAGGENSLLTLHRMAPDCSALLDDGQVVIDGHHHHPIIEGPKLYKRNGYYYIFAPAGGVKGGWQAVFRSRSITGPYEDRIALFQGNTDINGPHQGGWVVTPHGEDWFVHFQDRGPAGRIVHLQPVRWEDDWPLIGRETKARQVFEPVLAHTKPKCEPAQTPMRLPNSDSFAGTELGHQWQWMANPRPEWHELADGRLRLSCQGTPGGHANWWEAGNLLVQKPHDIHYRATVVLELHSAAPGDRAGLVLASGLSGAIVLEAVQDKARIAVYTLPAGDDGPPVLCDEVAHFGNEVVLRLEMVYGLAQFHWSPDGDTFRALGPAIRPTSAAWLGARIGLMALNAGESPSGGHGDFLDFVYEAID